MLEPLVTGTSLDLSPLHVTAVVLAAMAIGLIGVAIRRFLVAAAVELIDMWHGAAAWLAERVLRRRRIPENPWFCARCRSRNERSAHRCYACAAPRVAAEAAVPNAEPPVGPSAGRAQRTRRRG